MQMGKDATRTELFFLITSVVSVDLRARQRKQSLLRRRVGLERVEVARRAIFFFLKKGVRHAGEGSLSGRVPVVRQYKEEGRSRSARHSRA